LYNVCSLESCGGNARCSSYSISCTPQAEVCGAAAVCLGENGEVEAMKTNVKTLFWMHYRTTRYIT